MSETPMTVDQAMQLAVAQHRAGNLAQAAAIYAQICAAVPTHHDALHMAGVVAFQQGDAANAEVLIRRALAVRPSGGAWTNLGVALESLQRGDDAIAAFRNAVALEPHNIKALGRLGNLLCTHGNPGEGVELLARCTALDPGNADALLAHALALQMVNRVDDAIARYREVIALKPADIDARNYLGLALLRQRRSQEAVAVFRDAITLQPEIAKLHASLGFALIIQQAYADAEPVLRRAIALDIASDDVMSRSNLVSALLYQGHQAEAGALARKTLQEFPDAVRMQSPLLAALACDADCSPEEYLALARRFGAAVDQAWQATKPAPIHAYTHWRVETPGTEVAKLRVGFVSGDLRKHPVGYFLENVLAHIDPRRIEFVAYTTAPGADELTATLATSIHEWHDISGVVDEKAAAQIRDDRIHLLIDLAGHTAANRLPLFALRPAPVQLTWLGYSASTGLSAMDWILADAVSVPERERMLYSERCWYVPETRVCFTPPSDAPDVEPLPSMALGSESYGAVTFGTFQNMSKLGDRVLALYARILDGVPNSRLRVQNGELATPAARDAFLARLQTFGIAPSRVRLAGRMPRRGYLAAHADVDFLLDTFPYPGGTTTCEALWMGVPTLTYAGRTLLARYGASVLNAVGLNDWIADSEEDYVRRAIALAADPVALATLRSTLRERMRTSPLCDAVQFARRLEDALHGMWRAGPAAENGP